MGRIQQWFYGSEELNTPSINSLDLRHGSENSAGGTSPLPGVVPPARPTMLEITPESALGIGTVYRSVDIITTTVASLELGVYRNGIELATPPIIRSPDVNQTASHFVQETVWSLALYGNAYWKVYGSDPKNPASLEVLDPNSVTVTTDEKTGKKVYWIGNDKFDARYIKHLKLQRRPGQLLGVGPIQCAKSELTAALKLRQFADNWFDVSGVPTGVLTTDMQLNPQQAKDFAAQWNEFIKTGGGTVVLSAGLSYEAIRLKPAEAQFLEIQQANNVNIARLFGIPTMHLNVEMGGTSMTYMNLEQTNILFIQNTLVRYMNEIEEALSDFLPRGQRVQFKEEGLLRSDTVTKWKVLETQVGVGYTSGNELRAAEGKAPLPVAPKPEAENPVKAGDTTNGTNGD